MADSEYFVQIFLFVATILCYVALALFLFYGLYRCVRTCILKSKRKHEDDTNDEPSGNTENKWCRRVTLMYPFQRDGKNAIVAPISHTSKKTRRATDKNVYIEDNIISDNNAISNVPILDDRNPFIDKKYYDIFVA